MKSMKQMQDETFSKCDKGGGWPRPFVHFPGIVRLVHSQEEMDRVMREEILTLLLAPVAGVLLAGVIVWATHP